MHARRHSRERKRELALARARASLYLLAMSSFYVIPCPCFAAQANLIAPALPASNGLLPAPRTPDQTPRFQGPKRGPDKERIFRTFSYPVHLFGVIPHEIVRK